MPRLSYLDWPAPSHVKACYTLRYDGVSEPPFDGFNMGEHVGDVAAHVHANRQQLAEDIGHSTVAWLQQVHGTRVIESTAAMQAAASGSLAEADACVSQQARHVCCVMTADCLPVYFTDRQGTQVAVAHAGWRGLLDGVLQQTLTTFDQPTEVLTYLGPAISQAAFEVGAELKEAFSHIDQALVEYFIPSAQPHKWMADLYGIARFILTRANVAAIYGGTHCTYTEADKFFSYRRDGITGRMANLIWIE